MARQVQTNAKGAADPNAGPAVTPAPTRPAKAAAPDLIGTPRRQQNVGNSYGLRGYAGASSANPGEMVRSQLAENLKSSVQDDAIDVVIARGTAKQDASITGQLRSINAANKTPVTYGHRDPNAGNPKIG